MNIKYYIKNNNQLFWLLQISGWIAYAAIGIATTFLYKKDNSCYYSITLIEAAAGLILSGFLLRKLYLHIWQRSIVLTSIFVIAACYVFALTTAFIRNSFFIELCNDPEWQINSFFGLFKENLETLYIFLCWSGLYFGIKYYQMLQKQKTKTYEANTMAHQAQLKMLRYQLNPHFLFNTLNAISTLILEKNSMLANMMLSRLSDFLRHSLDNDPMQKVTLEQEMSALNLYVDIEKVRFEDRLQLDTTISQQASYALVPNLILQPLIENSIKYAIAKNDNGGIISIQAKTFGSDLLIEISDNGPGIDWDKVPQKKSKGIGIKNTKKRLAVLYNDNYSLTLKNAEPHGLIIQLRIPYETN